MPELLPGNIVVFSGIKCAVVADSLKREHDGYSRMGEFHGPSGPLQSVYVLSSSMFCVNVMSVNVNVTFTQTGRLTLSKKEIEYDTAGLIVIASNFHRQVFTELAGRVCMFSSESFSAYGSNRVIA